MVTVSQSAEQVLKDYFKDNGVMPIRIFLQTGD